MKNLSILSLALISLNAFAANSDLSIDSYCKKTSEQRVLSELSLKNNGKLSETDPRTQHTKEYYFRGCRYDTPWISKMYESLCNGTQAKPSDHIKQVVESIKAPKNILFFFDGAGDFNAQYANQYLHPVNIDGSEGLDLSMGNANGLSALISMMDNSNHELGKHKNEIELHYHAGSGFMQRENYSSAIACASETKYYLDVLNNIDGRTKLDTKWLVMGYSNGGALTIDFQNDLPNIGVSPELAFAIDPIVQTALYSFHKLKKTIGRKNDSTKRFVNLFQQTDIDSLPGFELRGKPVVNADVNFLITPTNSFDLSVDGNYNHVRVVGSKIVSDTINCEIGKIFNSPASCKRVEAVLSLK